MISHKEYHFSIHYKSFCAIYRHIKFKSAIRVSNASHHSRRIAKGLTSQFLLYQTPLFLHFLHFPHFSVRCENAHNIIKVDRNEYPSVNFLFIFLSLIFIVSFICRVMSSDYFIFLRLVLLL